VNPFWSHVFLVKRNLGKKISQKDVERNMFLDIYLHVEVVVGVVVVLVEVEVEVDVLVLVEVDVAANILTL